MKTQYIFTYGSLMKSFCNHGLIEELKLEFVDKAFTCEKYQMYPAINYAFPFLLESENNEFIYGEVYKLNSKKDLEKLDQLEGYPKLYYRKEIKTKLFKGIEIDAIIYFKNEDYHQDYIKSDEPIKRWTRDISSAEIDRAIEI